MHRIILTAVGGTSLLTAVYIVGAPQHWYSAVPGVEGTGPLNMHFARDVGLAFLSSGLALIWGGAKGNATAALCGSAWLVFHALFHLWIWAHRGFSADLVAFVNLTGIQLPAVLALWGALALHRKETTQ